MQYQGQAALALHSIGNTHETVNVFLSYEQIISRNAWFLQKCRTIQYYMPFAAKFADFPQTSI
jgi:hypothetical protein